MIERFTRALHSFRKRVVAAYMNLSLRQKHIVTFLLMVVLPMVVFAVFFNATSLRTLRENMLNSSRNILKQDTYYINQRISTVNQISEWVFLSSEFSKIASRDPKNYPLGAQIDDINTLDKYITSMNINARDIYGVRVYFHSNLIYSNTNYLFFNIETIKDSDWFRTVADHNGKIFWSDPAPFQYAGRNPVTLVSAARSFKGLKSNGQVTGILSIDIEKDKLAQTLESLQVSGQSRKFLVNGQGNPILSIPEESGDGLWGELRQQIHWDDNDQRVRLAGKDYYVQHGSINEAGWSLVFLIPASDVQNTGTQLRNTFVFVMLFVSLAAFLLAFALSRSERTRITELTHILEHVQENGFQARVVYQYTDEIDKLRRSCDYMIQNTRAMIEERYQMSEHIRTAELKALQAQINPHFLYNTLELINWTVEKGQSAEAQTLVNSLARYYKLSLSKGLDYASIRDEIEHIRIYVSIQNRRFSDAVELKINIEDEVYDHPIIRMVLQPLVENAILHGIMEKDDQKGEINITGSMAEGDRILLQIRDDGLGMSAQRMDDLANQRIHDHTLHGYGVWNIFERIRLYYGGDASLSYDSVEGIGTTATLQLPARAMPPSLR